MPLAAAPAVRHDPDQLHRIESVLTRLEQRLTALESRKPATLLVPSADAPPAEPQEPPEAAEPPDPVQIAAEREAKIAALDARLQSESADAAWSRQYEGQVLQKFKERFPKTRMLKSNCATTLCRFELAHDDAAESADFIDDYWHSLPDFDESPYFPSGDAQSGFKSVIYVIRRTPK
ncbi:MAG TPA: hypothetical protein VGK73_00055 [Polyangiaceae bacterium]